MLGLAWLAIGLRPFGTRADIPWMPKQRYDVMRAYMPGVGTRGLDMMQRTATVQVNLDFSDEADAAAKMRCLYSVTSLLTALWAASPIVDERVTDYQSYRAWIWRDTDNARSGLVRFAFERSDLFTAYTEWALDVPMYFVYRDGYKPVPAGLTFRTFMADGWNGARATRSDWALHLSTLFPEGRLKKFIEVRGCDCGSLEMIAALAPTMRGLLYESNGARRRDGPHREAVVRRARAAGRRRPACGIRGACRRPFRRRARQGAGRDREGRPPEGRAERRRRCSHRSRRSQRRVARRPIGFASSGNSTPAIAPR